MKYPTITILVIGLATGIIFMLVTNLAVPVERTKLYDRPVLEVEKTWEDGSIHLIDENGNSVYACLRGGLCND